MAAAAGGRACASAAAASGGGARAAPSEAANSAILLQELVRGDYLAKAQSLPPPQDEQLSLETTRKLAQLVMHAISHPVLFSFSELLESPAICKLVDTNYEWYRSLLCLFSFGTYKDIERIKDTLPKLNASQTTKMKQLTILSLLQSSQVIQLEKLMEAIDISDIGELEPFLTQFCKQTGITIWKLDVEAQTFQANEVPELRSASMMSGKSLEAFLQEAAAAVVQDPQTGLLSNDIVTQVEIPCPMKGYPFNLSTDFSVQAEFKKIGADIFSHLVALITDGHLAHKSWGGHIYPGMFVAVGGKVFLCPGANPSKVFNDELQK